MTVYRITNSNYKDDISGLGAKTYGGRWNVPGFAALYTSEHISLCVLEMLVNITLPESQIKYHVLQIQIPDVAEPAVITKKRLKANWEDDEGYTQFMGTEFLKNKQSLILKTPSAVISEEYNYIINPLHPEFKKVNIHNSYPFKFDKRLFIY
jgi:RES domain-containing protein